MILFLIGYMGCGKSKLGRKLAPALGWELMDTDKIIEAGAEMTVAEIFEQKGEPWFRARERAVLESLAEYPNNVVVSTGGGLACKGDNMERMNAIGQAVYLRRTAEQIASRLSPHGRQKRPKLRGLNDEELVAFMRSNMAEREPFYSQARYCIDCAAMSDEELIETILSIVKSNG